MARCPQCGDRSFGYFTVRQEQSGVHVGFAPGLYEITICLPCKYKQIEIIIDFDQFKKDFGEKTMHIIDEMITKELTNE